MDAEPRRRFTDTDPGAGGQGGSVLARPVNHFQHNDKVLLNNRIRKVVIKVSFSPQKLSPRTFNSRAERSPQSGDGGERRTEEHQGGVTENVTVDYKSAPR